MPRVGNASTNGGYCGPAVKPIALHMVAALARDPGIKVPISGIGGISTWRDAAEFIALGSTSVQVCTAVMHYGYRIVEDLIEGLSEYLDSHGMKSVNELRGRAVPGYQEWGDLDLNYKLVAKIDPKTCIGCQLCVTACNDGAHQCIFTGPDDKPRPPHAHAIGPAKAPQPAPARHASPAIASRGSTSPSASAATSVSSSARSPAASRWPRSGRARPRRGTTAWPPAVTSCPAASTIPTSGH